METRGLVGKNQERSGLRPRGRGFRPGSDPEVPLPFASPHIELSISGRSYAPYMGIPSGRTGREERERKKKP